MTVVGSKWSLGHSSSGQPWVYYEAGGDRCATVADIWAASRIAELEAAMRWRVTAEELPPKMEWLVGYYGGSETCEVVQYDGDQWNFPGLLDVNAPDFWLPIPPAPHV